MDFLNERIECFAIDEWMDESDRGSTMVIHSVKNQYFILKSRYNIEFNDLMFRKFILPAWCIILFLIYFS